MRGHGGRDRGRGWNFGMVSSFGLSLYLWSTHTCVHTHPMSVHAVNSAQVHCTQVPGGGGTGGCWGAEEEQ